MRKRVLRKLLINNFFETKTTLKKLSFLFYVNLILSSLVLHFSMPGAAASQSKEGSQLGGRESRSQQLGARKVEIGSN